MNRIQIIGAGPAGSTTAALLSGPDRHVRLQHRAGIHAMSEELLLRTAMDLSHRLGVASAFQIAAREGPQRRHFVWGQVDGIFSDVPPADRGFLIERTTFDSALRHIARACGADLSDSPPGERASQDTLILATGRSMREGAHGVHTIDGLPATVALTATITAGTYPDSVIEAVPEGWLWFLRLRTGAAMLTLFADAEEVQERGREAVFRAAVRSATAARPRDRDDLEPGSGAIATPALRETRGDAWLVGDAASTIDPLSGQGLEKALASAEHVALCVRTALRAPELADDLRRHRREWERLLFAAHARTALGFYLREQRFADAPFWRARHRAGAARVAPASLPPRIMRAPDLIAARTFRRSGATLEPLAGFRAGDDGITVAHLGELAVEHLLALVEVPSTVEDALARARHCAPLFIHSPSAIRGALLELLRFGILTAAPGSR